jgi:hypothetical protein
MIMDGKFILMTLVLLASSKSLALTAQEAIETVTPTIVATSTARGGDERFEIKRGLSSEKAEEVIGPRAKQAIRALKEQDWIVFSKFVHLEKGVCFSDMLPNALAPLFKRKDVRVIASDVKKYTWDRWSEPVTCTFSEFFTKYLFKRDYPNAPEVNYNKYHLMPLVSTVGLDVTYPNGIVVQYYFPMTSEENGNDMKSLTLVFEKGTDRQWYVVNVFNDYFTP